MASVACGAYGQDLGGLADVQFCPTLQVASFSKPRACLASGALPFGTFVGWYVLAGLGLV